MVPGASDHPARGNRVSGKPGAVHTGTKGNPATPSHTAKVCLWTTCRTARLATLTWRPLRLLATGACHSSARADKVRFAQETENPTSCWAELPSKYHPSFLRTTRTYSTTPSNLPATAVKKQKSKSSEP